MYASVIVATYNRQEILERTLGALQVQTIPHSSFEIIVVDDCSSDQTPRFMRDFVTTVNNVTYIQHRENLGRAQTRNDGIDAARGEILIFLDDDNVPFPDFVGSHLSYHSQAAPEHIAVMGNVSFSPEIFSGSNFARYLQSRYLGNRGHFAKAKLDYQNLPARCLGALNCSMRAEDLLAAGKFDIGFRYYGGEDEFLGFCLARLGIRIVFGEAARTVHYDNVSIERSKLKMLEASRGGLRHILQKNAEYFDGTQLRFLLPIDWNKDRPGQIVAKLALRCILHPRLVTLMETWAVLTDKNRKWYCPPMFRLLTAGWVSNAIRSGDPPTKLVTYGFEGPS